MVEQLLRSITTFLEERSAPPERVACGVNSEGGVSADRQRQNLCRPEPGDAQNVRDFDPRQLFRTSQVRYIFSPVFCLR
jgi:hypothetical protein